MTRSGEEGIIGRGEDTKDQKKKGGAWSVITFVFKSPISRHQNKKGGKSKWHARDQKQRVGTVKPLIPPLFSSSCSSFVRVLCCCAPVMPTTTNNAETEKKTNKHRNWADLDRFPHQLCMKYKAELPTDTHPYTHVPIKPCLSLSPLHCSRK